MNADESINKLNNRSDLIVKLIETLELTENCTSCKDEIEEYYDYSNRICESVSEMENHLAELEKKEQEMEDIIYESSVKLIKMDIEPNRSVSCIACGRNKLINKLFNLLNKLNNRSDLTTRITDLSNELLET